MTDWYAYNYSREDFVRDFQEKYGQAVNIPFQKGKTHVLNLLALRQDLLREEFRELDKSIDALDDTLINGDMDRVRYRTAEFIKEMADLQYVLSGLAVTFGIDLEEAFLRVHESNMSKLGEDGKPVYREDGKVLKGPNYKPPFLDDLVL